MPPGAIRIQKTPKMQETKACFFVQFIQARDLLRDTYQALGNFKKPGQAGPSQNPCRFTFRIMASCWQVQTLYSKDGHVRGVRIRIREDGVGAEFSQLLPNLASGTNVLNQLVRTGGKNPKNSKNANARTPAHCWAKDPHPAKRSNIATGSLPGNQKA